MFNFPIRSLTGRQIVALVTLVCFAMATSAYAQTAGPRTYDVEIVVPDGKKSTETDADIIFAEKTFQIVPDKAKYKGETRDIAYADIKQADQSYSKKPMLSGGGAVATALLIGVVFALPFLFIKKKKHWMTVQAGEKFAVIKLGDRNYRQIVAEFESHGVKVNDLKEQGK